MAVYFKFKSAKDYDSIPIEGQFISLANLKERIFESKHLGRGTDFDLMVSNAQTNEEYVDEAAMIPKNTSVLIRRVPGRPRKPIVTEPDEPKIIEDKVEDIPPSNSMIGNPSANPEESEWDEFGNDLYTIPEVLPAQPSNPVVDISPANRVDEDSKIKALIETPSLDWNRQTQEGYGSGRGFGRGMGGRMIAGRGFGRGGLERKTPPAGYVCHRCKVPGHFIQHCPTNGDPNYDIKRIKPPTGIPKSMLMATPDGSYSLPSGAVAVLKPNEAAFEKEIEGLPTTRSGSDLPPELHCPLCKGVMKDAVLTSRCCFSSFCDKCIRDYIISTSLCICGATNVLADDLLPNKTLRETIRRILESTTSSTENAGSLVQVQDMESAVPKKDLEFARHVQPKAPSPTLSATSKEEPKQPAMEHALEVKQCKGVSESKDGNVVMDKKAVKKVEPSEVTPESMSGKEPTSQESTQVPDEVQEKMLAGEQGKKKKKKKTRVSGSGSDVQWRGFQDLGCENFAGMPAAYNPYWAGGMPLGIDGYMAPFGGSLPFMGYAPGPFDVPFGGFLPQDPFGAQGYMLPAVPPRDLSELGMSSMGMHQGPPLMNREFEARKADLRRKREMERLREREHSRDRGTGKEASSIADVSSMKSKPRLLSQASAVERSDRRERSEKAASLDQYGPPRESGRSSTRDSGRHSPERERPARRGSTDRPDASSATAAKPERKQKGSVFSRISFPFDANNPGGSDDGGSKKRKSSEMPNGSKDHETSTHRAAASNGFRDEWKHAGKSSASVGGGAGRRGSSAHEHESSEEEYHFKRRPPSSSSRRESEWEEEGRHARVSRERDHERPAGKRR